MEEVVSVVLSTTVNVPLLSWKISYRLMSVASVVSLIDTSLADQVSLAPVVTGTPVTPVTGRGAVDASREFS